MGPAPAADPIAHHHETFHHAPHPVTATNESTLAKGPLDGVTVLDFASYIAGSYGPMILAQLGANVIKVESLDGDAFRSFGFGFLGWNQGKRGLAIDLNSREGLDIVYRLAEEADVLVENLRPGRMKRLRARLRHAREGESRPHLYVGQRVRQSSAPITISPASIRCCKRARA